MKKILLIFLCILSACFAVLTFKLNLFLKYKVPLVPNVSKKLLVDTFEIKKSNDLKGKPFVFEDAKIYYDFSNYEEEDGIYTFYDRYGDIDSTIRMRINEQVVNYFTSVVIEGEHDFFDDGDRKSFFKEYNIKNDLDLLRYIKDNYYFKSNIFTSINNLEKNYMLNKYVDIFVPNFDFLGEITGDYTGYILDVGVTNREVHLLHNGKFYSFAFYDSEVITDEFLINFISHVTFSK